MKMLLEFVKKNKTRQTAVVDMAKLRLRLNKNAAWKLALFSDIDWGKIPNLLSSSPETTGVSCSYLMSGQNMAQ